MSADIVITFAVAIVAIGLFFSEIIRADLVAILILVTLGSLDIISTQQAFNGFSNPATLTVLAMFVLSEGVAKSGFVEFVKEKALGIAGDSLVICTMLLMLFTGVLSMFINNTAVVALTIPVVVQVCKERDWSPSQLLLPISFSSMFGGVCTLIGTSTNLVANQILGQLGVKEFKMFSFFTEGLSFFVVGFIFLLVILKFIPKRRNKNKLEAQYQMGSYLFEMRVKEGAKLVGEYISVDNHVDGLNFDILSLKNGDRRGQIQAGDVLKVKSDIDTILKIEQKDNLEISRNGIENLMNEEGDYDLIEAIISPNSELDGLRLSEVELFKEFNAKVIAIRQRKGLKHRDFSKVTLRSGDTLLLYIRREMRSSLRSTNNFVLFKAPQLENQRRGKILITAFILALVMGLATFNILPIVLSSFLGVILMVLCKVISMNEAYKSINWQVIFLLAGVLALGEALDHSGGAELIAKTLNKGLSGFSLPFVSATFFAVTTIFTAFMSNNASVAIMIPIAVYSSRMLELPVEPIVLATMFGASMSVFTPIGYQTNMMIYNIGQYRFKDFVYIGAPLTFIFIILCAFVLS